MTNTAYLLLPTAVKEQSKIALIYLGPKSSLNLVTKVVSLYKLEFFKIPFEASSSVTLSHQKLPHVSIMDSMSLPGKQLLPCISLPKGCSDFGSV